MRVRIISDIFSAKWFQKAQKQVTVINVVWDVCGKVFKLTDNQIVTLRESYEGLTKDEENLSWHQEQKASSEETAQILKNADFGEGNKLSTEQLHEIGYLISIGLGSTALKIALGRGKHSMFEINDPGDFNDKLRNLLFSSKSLALRVDDFLDLKYVGIQTVSQFLCKFEPKKYPFYARYMDKVFEFLSIGENQMSEARKQAIQEFNLDLQNLHRHTIRYFINFVILREIKYKLNLEDYLETQNLLWIIQSQLTEEERSLIGKEDAKLKEIDLPEFIETVDLGRSSRFISPSYLRNPEKIRINHIIENCSNTSWVLPHFQRYFDWKKGDIRSFLESVFNGYYVGALLLWDSGGEPEVGVQPLKGITKELDNMKKDSVILDGQQRITSLLYAIRSPNNEKFDDRALWKDTSIYRDHPLYFYIDFAKFLDDPKSIEIIQTRSQKLSNEDCYKSILFPFFELEKYDDWVVQFERYLRKHSDNEDKIFYIKEAIRKKLSNIWSSYEIPYISLPKTMGVDQVTEIFEQLNTKGKKLSVFDLLIARLYKHDIELKALWDRTNKDYEIVFKYSKAVEKIPIYILQAISLYYHESSSAKRRDILDIYENIYMGKDSRPKAPVEEYVFEDHWLEFSMYLKLALEKLENVRDGFGVKDQREVPFAPMIPVLTALLKLIKTYDNKVDCYKKLDKWYWASVFTNSYSQAADTQMTTDFKEMKEWFKDDAKIPTAVSEMIDELPRLSFMEIKSKSNSKYRGVMSLIALEGAKDFGTSLSFENARGENDKDHIFPKSSFRSFKNVNSVLNVTWNSEETNRHIKQRKKPSVYIPEFILERYRKNRSEFLNILKTHFINKEAFHFMVNDEIELFLTQREKEILQKLREHFELEDSPPPTLITPETPYTNKKIFWDAFRSCQGYIYWVDKYFSNAGLELLAESKLDSKRVERVKILTSSARINEGFRKLFKDLKEELNNNGIKLELRVIIDPKVTSSFHDRWIISKNKCFNVTSTDVAARGQYSEIRETTNRPPFDQWWSSSKDIITDWNQIKNYEQKRFKGNS